MKKARKFHTTLIPLAVLTLWSTAAATGDGFIATQGEGGEGDATRIYNGKGDVVKKLDRSGKAMAFDKSGNLFVGESAATDGTYAIWHYAYKGGADWSAAEKFCEVDATPRALAVDSDSGVVYIGLDESRLSNVYRCAKRGDIATLFCGVNDRSRQIQDIEIGPNGEVWLGLVAWGYLRFPKNPTEQNRFAPELTIYNTNGNVGGFAIGTREGKRVLYGSVNGKLEDIGYYDLESGLQLCILFSEGARKFTNYCMTLGPDRSGDGIPDLYVASYNDRIHIYDGSSGAKLGEMADGLPNIYVTGLSSIAPASTAPSK